MKPEYRKSSQPFIPCKGCGKMFRPFPRALRRDAGKFCSIACYRVRQHQRPAFVTVTCANCGHDFRRTQAAINRVKVAFCSKRCSNEYISGERHHAYRGGERHRRGPGWRTNRNLCRERDKVCRSCGKTPEDNGQALSVDHVIPWRLFADERAANDLGNLIALCRNCHAKKYWIETAYIKGDVLGWLAFLEDVQIDPTSLVPFEKFLLPAGQVAA